MTTYAIGDLQGCREQFEQLLEQINFDPAQDRLWLSGDMVNRGPDSLGTLRLMYSLKDQISMVLGNHDLHMLASASNSQLGNRKDTFTDVLEADDSEKLLSWLQNQPLLHESNEYIMVHAGIHPSWSLEQARRYAAEVETVLRSDMAAGYFQAMYGNMPDQWSEQLQGMDRLRCITNSLTRMRYCYLDGRLDMLYKKPIASAPDNLIPWFSLTTEQSSQQRWEGKTLLIGHWASLQILQPKQNIICLDTGCCYGNKLSAYALKEKAWYQVPGLKQQ